MQILCKIKKIVKDDMVSDDEVEKITTKYEISNLKKVIKLCLDYNLSFKVGYNDKISSIKLNYIEISIPWIINSNSKLKYNNLKHKFMKLVKSNFNAQ